MYLTQQYSTKSANDSGVEEDVVVMIGSAPMATAMSMTSNGPAIAEDVNVNEFGRDERTGDDVRLNFDTSTVSEQSA